MSVKGKIRRHLINLRGWKTGRKIVVFESDDWGSIRMPDKAAYRAFLKKGYPVDRIAYEKFDSLASEADLSLLFDTLSQFRDHKGKHPVITANVIMGNPDFEKIKASGFEQYYYEHFTETLKKYPRHGNSFALWQEGMRKGLFFPQYHGREHLNVSKFMKALQARDKDTHFAFEYQLPGAIPHGMPPRGNAYVESLRYDSELDKWEKLAFFLEGYRQFAETFGFASKTVIPPNYTWSPDYHPKAAQAGIGFYQGIWQMKEPLPETGKRKNKLHKIYMGKVNAYGQRFLIRNAVFEPSLFKLGIKDPVGNCLREISTAFLWKKPAIITSHRLNYIGYLDEANRDRNLKLLAELIRKILKKWTDVEFHHSAGLATMIEKPDK
ncbi:hypothetical protein [Negadavirga shengliensis]|uniref:Glycoside hydrolase family 42 N-terminal domain-containing protein n=1 Tax=Negadavirga shengliensis TaxID=1389218 RepID=A0ABV9SYR1_9BACT